MHICHYNNVIMSVMVSQITSLTIVYSSVYLGPDERKHQSSAPLAFVRGIHRSPVNSPHKGPVTLAPADCTHFYQGYFMGIVNQNTVFFALDTKNAKDIFCQLIVISLHVLYRMLTIFACYVLTFMFGMLFLFLTTSLGCFCPRILLFK